MARMIREFTEDDPRTMGSYGLAPCTDQEFFDTYCEMHYLKFGVEFEPERANPQW